MTYKISITPDSGSYWPFWPFRWKRTIVFRLPRGFTLEVDQANVHSERGHRCFTGNPLKVSGYVSTDRTTATTTVSWGEGPRLRRETKLR